MGGEGVLEGEGHRGREEGHLGEVEGDGGGVHGAVDHLHAAVPRVPQDLLPRREVPKQGLEASGFKDRLQ